MGCDIHLRVERRTGDGWRFVPGAVPGCGVDPWPGARNYYAFALLADVRNGDGFVITPQFPERGLPLDIDRTAFCPVGLPVPAMGHECADECEDFADLGDHSFTHATLAELLGAPWDVTVRDTGFIEAAEYARWLTEGGDHPRGWCRGVGGYHVRIVTSEEFAAMCIHDRAAPSLYVRATWEWKPLIACDFRRWLDTLAPLAAESGGNDGVRVLMGFDS